MALALQYLGASSTLRGLALKFACEASMPPLPHTPGSQTLPPTHRAATARVASINPAAYARTRNHLQGAVTGLSPYLTHGLMTLLGRKSQLARATIEQARPDLPIIQTPHPSPMFVNRKPGNRALVLDGIRQAARFI